ncbi:MAG: hypothetical protein K0S70_5273 [Microbacterium sp.]|nr:hypothetical protein [Microbacterium sp.]
MHSIGCSPSSIGTGVTLALSGVETVAFLEATALFAQSVTEVHGIPVADPDRARALVLTLMLGKEGVDLVAQLAGQVAGRGPSRDKYWGELVTKTLPRAAVGPLVDRLKTTFIHQFAARGGASGKALPFGIGAAIGGAGNNILGRRVLVNARRAFGPPPSVLPPDLEPRPGAQRLERAAGVGIRRAGAAVVGGVTRSAGAVGRLGSRVVRRPQREIEGSSGPDGFEADLDELASDPEVRPDDH